jgi:predicted 3-demethylubiquinone-9 3-methyltransferase (glyoxalase superfamily)
MALNGGPTFKFNEAVSLVANCDTQEELDAFWEKLSEGGEKLECGWVKDRFGLAWQIVPSVLPPLLTAHGPGAAARVLHAVWKMEKLDIDTLERAAAGHVRV